MARSTISVFITLYNHERFIRRTIQSALNQTLSPYEIIVVDDASTDDSLCAARSVVHSSIHVFREKHNLGGSNTVKGLSRCKGQFVAILNSDDAWESEKLSKQFAIMSSLQTVCAVFTHITAIDEHGVPWDFGTHQLQQNFNISNRTRHEWLRHFFLNGNPFCASSAFIRKQCLEEVGSINGSYIQLQDFDMWVRLAIAGYDLHVIEEPLTRYRVMRNGTNMSTDNVGARATNTFEYAMTLRHFWRLSSLNELTRVFPEIPVHNKADDSLILFYLARYAASLPSLHHRMFALETMFRWGGDPDSMELARECHGFGFREYRHFCSSGPIRQMLRFNIRHQLNRFFMSIMPYSIYQQIKVRLSKLNRVIP